MPMLGIDASRAIKKEKTGVEWYSYHLLRAMEKCTPEGWKVKLYSDKEEGTWDLENTKWKWKILKWVSKGWTQGRLSVEMATIPPEVLFVPSHVIPIIHPDKTITTIHDVVFLNHPELYDPEDIKGQRRGFDFTKQFANKIIVPSKATRDDAIKEGVEEKDICVIPHGVTNIKEITDIKKIDSPYILFIGRIEKKKNVMNLIHAFRNIVKNLEYADLKLVLAGSLGFGSEDILLAIKTFKLEGKVIHLGWVSSAERNSLLKNSKLLILPSFGEGFGLPVLEAMKIGVPVSCSDIPVLREVGSNTVQYFDPYDPESISNVVKLILSNEMLQNEMIQRGKERALKYSWDNVAKLTWNVIENV